MQIIDFKADKLNKLLPPNIFDSEILSNNAKIVLGAILNYIKLNEKAKAAGFLVISNQTLRKSVGMKTDAMFEAITELQDADLIERKSGKGRTEGQKAVASEYHIRWDNMLKPVKKKDCFEDFFSQYLNTPQTCMGTAITNTISITTSITNSNTIPNTDSTTETDTVPATIIEAESINNTTTPPTTASCTCIKPVAITDSSEDNKIIEDINKNYLNNYFKMNNLDLKDFFNSRDFPLEDSIRQELFDRTCLIDQDDDEYQAYQASLEGFTDMTEHGFNQARAIQYWKKRPSHIWNFVADIQAGGQHRYASLVQPLTNVLELALRNGTR